MTDEITKEYFLELCDLIRDVLHVEPKEMGDRDRVLRYLDSIEDRLRLEP